MQVLHRNRWLIPLAAALTGIAMVVVALLYQEIKQLDETWIDASQERLNEATLLTELERSLGYGGFIHHFSRPGFGPGFGVLPDGAREPASGAGSGPGEDPRELRRGFAAFYTNRSRRVNARSA
jgi:hypothetical protein